MQVCGGDDLREELGCLNELGSGDCRPSVIFTYDCSIAVFTVPIPNPLPAAQRHPLTDFPVLLSSNSIRF